MRRWLYIDGRSLRLLLRQLQHLCGEINVILLAIAIGLAILDYTYFLSLRLAAALHTHEREHQESTQVILPRHCRELFDRAVSVTGPRISAKGAKSLLLRHRRMIARHPEPRPRTGTKRQILSASAE